MATNEAESNARWVTFHDVMDDAMENGKLLPIKRRMSSSINATPLSASLTSSVSSSSLEMQNSREMQLKKHSFDFSQSYGNAREIQKRKGPQRSKTIDIIGASDDEDKYAVFSKLDKSPPGSNKGWSGKVLAGSSGPLGWSDEVLGVNSEDDDNLIDNLNADESAWHLNLHKNTWDRSPNRSFVRNFP